MTSAQYIPRMMNDGDFVPVIPVDVVGLDARRLPCMRLSSSVPLRATHVGVQHPPIVKLVQFLDSRQYRRETQSNFSQVINTTAYICTLQQQKFSAEYCREQRPLNG